MQENLSLAYRSDSDIGTHSDVSDRHYSFIETLYKDHWVELCRSLRKLYGQGPPDPEDVAQEAFAKLISLEKTEHIHHPKAFLFKVAVNIGLKSVERIRRNQSFVEEALKTVDEEFRQTPEDQFSRNRKLKSIEKAFEKMSSKQREIVIRARIKGETYAEIKSETGWSQPDICRQLKSALAILESE